MIPIGRQASKAKAAAPARPAAGAAGRNVIESDEEDVELEDEMTDDEDTDEGACCAALHSPFNGSVLSHSSRLVCRRAGAAGPGRGGRDAAHAVRERLCPAAGVHPAAHPGGLEHRQRPIIGGAVIQLTYHLPLSGGSASLKSERVFSRMTPHGCRRQARR